MATPTGVLFYDPRPKPLSAAGTFQPGCYYIFFATGTTTAANVYADGTLTTPLSQTPGAAQPSCTADSAGRMNPIYMDPTVIYRVQLYTALGVLLEDTDPYIPQPQVNLYPVITALEGVSVVNTQYPYGYVDRYGTNTTPGTTDMGPALQAAINVALATLGGASGKSGVPVRFQWGAYSIATLPVFPANGAQVPIDIGGVGIGTQLINNAPAYPATGSGALFDMGNISGWVIHDLLITGNSAQKNDGIYAGDVSFTTEQVQWRIENVTAMMAGVGLQIANTNDGVVRGCRFWPNDPPTFVVPQLVNATDVGHHIHMTGGFVNLVSFYDIEAYPSRNFFGGTNLQRGILMDCASSLGVKISGADLESYSGNAAAVTFTANPTGTTGTLTSWPAYSGTQTGSILFSDGEIRTVSISPARVVTWTTALTSTPGVSATVSQIEVGLQIAVSGSCQNLSLDQIYLAQTQIQMRSCIYGKFSTLQDDGSQANGGMLTFLAGCRTNVIESSSLDSINDANSTNHGNTFIAVSTRNQWLDQSAGPVDRRINCLVGAVGCNDWGGTDSINLTVTGGVLSGTLNCFQAAYYLIVENDNTNWSVPLPLNPVTGFELQIDIINSSGGAGPAITFTSGFHMTSNTPTGPTNGNQSTFRFRYNGTSWGQQFAPAPTVPD